MAQMTLNELLEKLKQAKEPAQKPDNSEAIQKFLERVRAKCEELKAKQENK